MILRCCTPVTNIMVGGQILAKDKSKNYKVYSMKRFKILMYWNMFLATILGIFGQWIAYYISNNMVKVPTVYCLTVLTVISILLFLIIPILIYRCMKK